MNDRIPHHTLDTEDAILAATAGRTIEKAERDQNIVTLTFTDGTWIRVVACADYNNDTEIRIET